MAPATEPIATPVIFGPVRRGFEDGKRALGLLKYVSTSLLLKPEGGLVTVAFPVALRGVLDYVGRLILGGELANLPPITLIIFAGSSYSPAL